MWKANEDLEGKRRPRVGIIDYCWEGGEQILPSYQTCGCSWTIILVLSLSM